MIAVGLRQIEPERGDGGKVGGLGGLPFHLRLEQHRPFAVAKRDRRDHGTERAVGVHAAIVAAELMFLRAGSVSDGQARESVAYASGSSSGFYETGRLENPSLTLPARHPAAAAL